MAVQSGASELNIQTAWDNESDDDDENDSWDNKDDDSDDDDSDDGLQTYDANKNAQVMQMNTNVKDDDDLSESDEENEAKNMSAALGDNDEVLVDDTSNKYYQLGTNEAERYKMVEYGGRFFQKSKHESLFKKKDIATLLEFEQYVCCLFLFVLVCLGLCVWYF